MKIKLLVIIAAFGAPLTFYGQGVFFYNKGKMTVKGTSPTSTVLYIKGDFVAGQDANTTCNIVLDNSKTVLTGQFTHNATRSTVFDVANANTNAFKNSVFEFRGTVKQAITNDPNNSAQSLLYANVPSKETAYINFPTILVNNKAKVTLAPYLAAKAANVTLNTGWFVLEAERIGTTNAVKGETTQREYYASNPGLSGLNPDQRSAMAHLQVTDQVNYNFAPVTPADRGFIEVQMKLDPANSYPKNPTEAANKRFGSIIGFGIPFKGMKTDYFTWNFLMEPNQYNYFGPDGNSITDRKRQMIPGKGYLVGIDLRGNQYDNYYDWDNNNPSGSLPDTWFNSRAKDGYVFNRSAFVTNPNNAFGTAVNTAFTEEVLNTNDVTVPLHKGFNYLANPYTAPLDVSELLEDNTTVGSSGSPNSWGLLTGPTASSTIKRDIMNWVYVLNGTSKGSGYYNMWTGAPEPANRFLQLEMNFFVAKKVGGTYYSDVQEQAGGKVIIPPLQMFAVYSNTDSKSITIPRNKQVMGNSNFIRSTSPTSERYDDFVFEVVDKKTFSTDRVSVVLRPKEEVMNNPNYGDVAKTKVATDTRQGAKVTRTEDGEAQSVASLLYTKNATNSLLSVNYVPYAKDVQSKVSTPLYLKPSILAQSIAIRGFRLDTKKEFETIILEDKQTGKKVEMNPETVYETTIKPTDNENRFVLHFIRNVDGIEDELQDETSSKSITSYYANSTLTVAGFDEADFGSSLSVYDIQGRAIRHAKVDDFTMNIVDTFSPGAYIVKVVGNSSYVAKFIVR